MILFKGKPAVILTFYAFAVAIALWMGYWSGEESLEVIEGESYGVAVQLFLYIILFTAAFLLLAYLLKDKLKVILFLVELFFLFFTSLLFFSSILGDLGGFVWASFLVLLRALLRRFDVTRNISAGIVGGVAAGVMGYSLSPHVSLFFYTILILYDFVSVFLTKHMIKLVESVEGVGKGGDSVALGGGDLVLPVMFAVSFMEVSPIVSLLSSTGAILGVFLAFHCLKKLKHPLPALPYIGAVQIPLTALALYLSTLLP